MRPTTSLFRIFFFTLMSLSLAADVVHFSHGRLPPAGASHFATHGVASRLPHRERLISACDTTKQVPLSEKLTWSPIKSSLVEVASVNVKALAHGGISYLLNLASTNNMVDSINNGTASAPVKLEPDQDNRAFSGRKHVACTSIALVLVMLFFAVWM